MHANIRRGSTEVDRIYEQIQMVYEENGGLMRMVMKWGWNSAEGGKREVWSGNG